MNYDEMWKEAEKTDTARNLTPDFLKFTELGQAVCGKLISRTPVDSSMGEGTYMQYLLETDSGLVKCALGAATDHELAATIEDGGIYRIEYQGKIAIKGGRQVNRFRVWALDGPGPREVSDEDIPF